MEKESRQGLILLSWIGIAFISVIYMSISAFAYEESSYQKSSFGQAPVNPIFPLTDDFGESDENKSVSRSPSSVQPDSPLPILATPTGVQEVSLIAGDLGFFPKTIFVYPETPVKLFLTSTSSNTLCLILDNFQIRKQIKNKEVEEITFTPKQPGTYTFYCPVNGASGSLVVKEFSSEQLSNKRQPANE